MAAAATGPSPLWYLTRGTGLVALLLLTATVALGVLTERRWKTPEWPRFATVQLHRYVSLLVVAVLAIHILTAELDTFAPVGWLSVLVPFASRYRPIWLGLGTLAFDLLLALTVTSLLRNRLGYRVWKAVHWLAYASWPVALVHGLGTGTDARLGWAQLVYVASILTVLAAVAWRLAHGSPETRPARLLAGSAAAAVAAGVFAWAQSGPLQAGWAKRAGTPTHLLAANQGVSSPAAGSGPVPAPATAAPAGIPALPFTAELSGTLSQSRQEDSFGEVRITVSADVSGPMTGTLVVDLSGRPEDSGVSMRTSSVSFGPSASPGMYQGTVVALEGNQLVAVVRSASGASVELGMNLQIDPSSGSVSGTLDVQAPAGG